MKLNETKLEQDARDMMKDSKHGYVHNKELHKRFPDSDYRSQVLKKMIEIAREQDEL